MINPTGFHGRWVTGNLFLQEEDIAKALPHFSYILHHYPEQSGIVYDFWLRVVDDPDFLLERLVPEEPSSLSSYLSYVYENNDTESAKKVWRKKISLDHKVDRSETLRHIDFLIARNEFNEAMEVWKARIREEGLSIPTDGNLVTNGGFEQEKILGGGFDWKFAEVSGAKVSFDRSVAFEGERSLRIAFDGKQNVDFHHVHQTVALKPNTDYLLKAYIKTKEITTKSGPKIEVYGIGSTFHGSSESVVGDNAWNTGQRAPGLRFGQPRVMAVFAALARFAPNLNGFRHAELRDTVQALGTFAEGDYTTSQMSYDLRRLRLKGMIVRVKDSHLYILTTYGRRVVYLMTKLQQRIFNVASLALADTAMVSSVLAQAFQQICRSGATRCRSKSCTSRKLTHSS